ISETQNFGPSGATSCDWRVLDVNDKIIRQGSVASPAITYELSSIPGGKLDCISMRGGVMENENVPPLASTTFTVSGLGGPPITNAHRVIVTPRLCPGCPPPFVDIESLIITSVGISSFDVLDSRLRTFDADCDGVGAAHISEQCTLGSGFCNENDRRLVVTN